MSDTSTLEHVETRTVPFADDGDHDRFAHYISHADREKATFDGIPATALCGKKWLPTKDPRKFPVCPTCTKVYSLLQPGEPTHPDYKE